MKENEKEKLDIEFKIITLGNIGVGKTSIIQRFVSDEFNLKQFSTMGISHNFKIIETNKKKIKLQLIDTGGQEKYRSLSISYFRHVDAVLFVFDLNNPQSFDSIQYWIDLFNENDNGKNIKGKYLIGNKSDLEQKVDQNLIDELTQKNNILYWSTSANTKHQIDHLFNYISGDLYDYLEKNPKKKEDTNASKGKIISKTNLNKKEKKWC